MFVRHRTPKEIAEALNVDVATLRDPQPDSARVQEAGMADRDRRLHPPRLHPDFGQGDYGGWFCPCHGSVYDTSGRIRKGPAPLNLLIPD